MNRMNVDYNEFIEIQPKQNLNFRYETSLKRGEKHGVLSGQGGKGYPKIKLTFPNNSDLDNNNQPRILFVLCSLHCYNDNRKTLSPHLLLQKGEMEFNYRFIFEEMEIVNNNPLERVWELKDYFIGCPIQKDYAQSLRNKKQEFEKLHLVGLDFQNLLGQLDITNNNKKVKDSGELNVCLGFTIFEKDSKKDTYSLYKDTFYSWVIYNADDLRIHKLCNIKGSVLGGTKVYMLIRFESYLPLTVYIKEIDERTKRTLWHKTVEINTEDRFNKSALWFRTPKYDGQGLECSGDEICVFMCVVVKNTTYKSNIVPFYYVKEKAHKRKTNTGDEPTTSSKIPKVCKIVSHDYEGSEELPSPTEYDVSELDILISKIDQIFNTTSDQCVSPEFKELVFRTALNKDNAFIHLYKTANATANKGRIADFRNDNGENLLHWACRNNQYQRIRPLIGMGCHINKQDHLGRTPLHVALFNQTEECILQIQNLFKIYSEYSKEVEDDLVKMMKAYNDNGYTVLHESMLAGYYELFEIMLDFMQKHDMIILDYKMLGSGNSIGHLAVKRGILQNIRPLIEKYTPNYETAENYAGVMVKDLINEVENLQI